MPRTQAEIANLIARRAEMLAVLQKLGPEDQAVVLIELVAIFVSSWPEAHHAEILETHNLGVRDFLQVVMAERYGKR